eukprot:1143992-Prorocentrum_minimum.AAC.1
MLCGARYASKEGGRGPASPPQGIAESGGGGWATTERRTRYNIAAPPLIAAYRRLFSDRRTGRP